MAFCHSCNTLPQYPVCPPKISERDNSSLVWFSCCGGVVRRGVLQCDVLRFYALFRISLVCGVVLCCMRNVALFVTLYNGVLRCCLRCI